MTQDELSNAPPPEIPRDDVTNANGAGQNKSEKPERMKRTPSGLTYNGETAVFSNFYDCKIRYAYKGRQYVYISLEQAYSHIKCLENGDEERAVSVLRATKSLKCKQIANAVIVSDEWEHKQEEIMEDLMLAKFIQNPHLGLKLRELSPYPLIECTLCEKWGGAAIFGSKEYEDGSFKGKNRQGKILANVRDQLIVIHASMGQATQNENIGIDDGITNLNAQLNKPSQMPKAMPFQFQPNSACAYPEHTQHNAGVQLHPTKATNSQFQTASSYSDSETVTTGNAHSILQTFIQEHVNQVATPNSVKKLDSYIHPRTPDVASADRSVKDAQSMKDARSGKDTQSMTNTQPNAQPSSEIGNQSPAQHGQSLAPSQVQRLLSMQETAASSLTLLQNTASVSQGTPTLVRNLSFKSPETSL